MGLRDELDNYVAETHKTEWKRREGRKVPSDDDISLGNEAVEIEGTVLYADLAESTKLVKSYKDWFAAEVYKNYLYCAGKLIRQRGGEITAYDGDRIMAVFYGGTKNTDAAKCGLQIHYAAEKIVQPAIKAQYPTTPFVISQRVGIDMSDLFVAKTGIRGKNDLVWVGNAANNAAKMAALSRGYATYISATAYNMLLDRSKYGGTEQKNMWTDLGTGDLGYRIYGSNWWWSI